MSKYFYPHAGNGAPPEVKKAIARYRELPESKKRLKPLLYWLLGSGTPDYKMSKRDSMYELTSGIKGENCGNCEFAFKHVATGNFICSQIDGTIRPKAWCKLWA